MYKEITQCRICGNSQLVQVLNLGTQALTGVFPKTRTQAVTAGPLRLVKCVGSSDVCGLLQLQHTYDSSELYGHAYGYRSGLNPRMVSHLQAKVHRILQQAQLPRDALIIDIGANDSTTLQAYPKDTVTLVGVDPTAEKFKEFYPQHIHLIADFFSGATMRRHFGGRKASVITSFSMFYDLDDPLQFVREIREVLDDQGIWVFEQSYMPAMLRQNSYDTVCHEHLEYYALRQIKWLLDQVGMKITEVEFNDVNGGSFSVSATPKLSARSESGRVREILESEQRERLDTLAPYHEFARRVSESKASLREFIEKTKHSGNTISGLGASTKGNVVLQYCNITEAEVSRIGEVNCEKYGSFTPGTLLPIVAEEELLTTPADYLLVLPWHFRSFFMRHPKFVGRTLLFALPQLEVARCQGPTAERLFSR